MVPATELAPRAVHSPHPPMSPRLRHRAALAALAALALPGALLAQTPAAARDTAELRAAYRGIEQGMRGSRSFASIVALLAPDFEHRALDGQARVRVTPRAAFVARLERMDEDVDSVVAFTIDVSDVTVRGDSAEVAYREHLDAFFSGGAPGAAARARSSSTSWWRDRWVRTPEGWRVVRFEQVRPPAVEKDRQAPPRR